MRCGSKLKQTQTRDGLKQKMAQMRLSYRRLRFASRLPAKIGSISRMRAKYVYLAYMYIYAQKRQ